MKLGVFIPTGNNGWIISSNSPDYMPTYAFNRDVVCRAESYGFTLGLGMVSFRGYGGATGHWNATSEPITQTAAILASTEKMQIFASVGVLAIHPAMMARMAATIADVAPGRFGLNITTGWHRAEYAQMGMWPGDEYFGYRYDYATEYATILRQLWDTGVSDFKGTYFQLDDCRMGFRTDHPIKVAAAGASERGREFAGRFADYNFTMASDAESLATANAQLKAAAQGRDVRVLSTRTVILDDTDDLAQKKIEHYNAGSDVEALTNQRGHYAVDSTGTSSSASARALKTHQAIDPANPALFAGSPRTVATKLNELAALGGLDGCLMDYDDFVGGLNRFGQEVVPLLDFDITR
ncbi:LLM class flavin-dependent oxidoreductase [Microbacterium trichothecenolyticum]|uniref:LLM class flavin-dependent oxidoreductase n=1 Tax=Microbacterium trichothecenolyticum TaxID=69370 RepID=UPI001C6E0098|nr:LLM class flavin-dependent oxidoreductase [Microbacterium trichothecenolyticum]MBW9122086.1 LLM class flavin-dependent oxidoreductase [Microbacterium trichothecenolyticum]